MKIKSAVYMVSGTLILFGVTLAQRVSPWWLLLVVLVGVNLVQSAITGFCPLEIILKKLGFAEDEKQ